MNPKGLIIAASILAVLGGLVYYSEQNPPAEDDDRPSLISVAEEDVQELTIARPDAEPMTLRRNEEGRWAFEGKPFPPDESAVDLMAGNAAELKGGRVVRDPTAEQAEEKQSPEPIDWKMYGLADSGKLRLKIRVRGGEQDPEEKTYEVVFGEKTPAGSAVFARMEGDPRLFTVPNHVQTSFDKSVFDLRDKKLLQVEENSVSRVKFFVNGRYLEFGKSGENRWQILDPRPLRADNVAVGDLVRSARDVEMVEVLAGDVESAKEYSFRKPYAEVEIVDGAGAHKLTIAKRDDAYYAKSSDMPGVYEVSSTMAEGLDKPLEELRNKKLFDFGFNEVSRVDVRDGDTRLALVKKEQDWVLESEEGRKADSSKAQKLIDSLRNLTAVSFPDDAGDKARYGLDSPAIEARVTPAGGDAEKVLISAERSGKFYAARDGEPSIYELEPSAVEEIRTAVEELLAADDPEQETDAAGEPDE